LTVENWTFENHSLMSFQSFKAFLTLFQSHLQAFLQLPLFPEIRSKLSFIIAVKNFLFQTVKNFLSKLSKFSFPNCQNNPFETVKIFLSKLSKFPFPNCQNYPFQTVKIFLSKLSKFSFPNCQNFPFQTVKITLFKLSKFLFPNCQNFPFQTVKISLSKLSKISLSKLSKFPFPNYQKSYLQIDWCDAKFLILFWCVAAEKVWGTLFYRDTQKNQ
jgi:hypothetical protein